MLAGNFEWLCLVDLRRQRAVAGMNWAMPIAPARLTELGSKLLSCRIKRVKKSTGMPWVAAARCSGPQLLSVGRSADADFFSGSASASDLFVSNSERPLSSLSRTSVLGDSGSPATPACDESTDANRIALVKRMNERARLMATKDHQHPAM